MNFIVRYILHFPGFQVSKSPKTWILPKITRKQKFSNCTLLHSGSEPESCHRQSLAHASILLSLCLKLSSIRLRALAIGELTTTLFPEHMAWIVAQYGRMDNHISHLEGRYSPPGSSTILKVKISGLFRPYRSDVTEWKVRDEIFDHAAGGVIDAQGNAEHPHFAEYFPLNKHTSLPHA